MISAVSLTNQGEDFAQNHKSTPGATPRTTWWQGLRRRVSQATGPAKAPEAPGTAAGQQFTLASIALGVATTGALLYPPAQVACLPVLLAVGVTPVQAAYRALRTEGRVTVALAETTVLALAIARGYYLVGSLGCCCYYLGRLLWEGQPSTPTHLVGYQPPTWAWIELDGQECATNVSALHTDDIIVVHTGEMVPVTGVVTAGTAWVKAPGLAAQATPTLDIRQAGCTVEPATIVQAGCLWIAVAPLA